MSEGEEQPICRPWLVRALRKRPKLVEIETRERFLERMDQVMCERRKPDRVAKRLSRNSLRSIEDSMEPAVAETVKDRMEDANEGLLKRL